MALTRATGKQITVKNEGTGSVVRNLQDKLNEAVSVKDFGAVGDGVTDDTTAIQAAFTFVEAKTKGTIFFPSGTYKITSSVGSDIGGLTDLALIGEVGTVIDCQPTVAMNYAFNLQWQDLNTCIVENFRIKGNNKVSTAITVRSSSTTESERFEVRNCTITDLNVVDNASITTSANGIFLDSGGEGYSATIENCRVENVSRDKVSFSTGMSITDFRTARIHGCYIKNVSHNNTNLADADGIKIFSEHNGTNFNNITASITDCTIIDCEGRFIKTQTTGSVRIENNRLRNESDITWISNFRGIDTQSGESHIVGNDIYLASKSNPRQSACVFSPQSPDDSLYEGQLFVTTIKDNNVNIKGNSLSYWMFVPSFKTYTVPAKIVFNVINNQLLTSSYELDESSTLIPYYFIYANNSSWPIASALNSNHIWNIKDNIVHSYNFIELTTGTEDYTDKWWVRIHNNRKFPSTISRNILSGSTSYTSNLSISGNQIGNDSTGAVYWPFDFLKLETPCEFYNGSGTRYNGPSSYSWTTVTKNNRFWTVEQADGDFYKSSNASTWTFIDNTP
jgi:hypothetical protein